MTKIKLSPTLLDRFQNIFPVGKRQWKKRALAGLMTGTFLLLSANALAQNIQTQPISPNHPNIAFIDLGVIDSKPSESKDDFMLRVGSYLDNYTGRTNHEACGMVMSSPNGDRWRVRVITNQSHIACVRMVFDEPGFQSSNETIHSHPEVKNGRSIFANINDQALRQFSKGQRLSISDEDFSEMDISNGPGYLVARGHLLHQEAGHKRMVGSINRDVPIDWVVSLPNPTGRMVPPDKDRMMSVSATDAVKCYRDLDGNSQINLKKLNSGNKKGL